MTGPPMAAPPMTGRGNNHGSQLVLSGGSLITGDGKTHLESASIRIKDGVIVEISEGPIEASDGETVVSTKGHLMLPGFINGHAHATIAGPSMPSGSLPLSLDDVRYQRNRHLLSGTTSLINVCGLALPEERDGALEPHVLDIHMTSAHTPHSLAAADQIDGQGLTPRHRSARLEELVSRGCRVLGEAGGGQTLGGGAQDYRFIPDAIEEKTGVRISAHLARQLKEAVLGRNLDGKTRISEAALQDLLDEHAIDLTARTLAELLRTKVLAPVHCARLGLEEIAEASARLKLPAIFHHALPTATTLIALAKWYPGPRMVAAHANHPSFRPEEACAYARALKALGVVIDVSTLDMIETRFRNHPDNLDALVDAGLVDTLSTDYAGGDWDSIASALHRITRKNGWSLPRAVALATGNVAHVFPELFADRGLLQAGRKADIVIAEPHNISKIRHVYKDGRLVVSDGVLFPGMAHGLQK